MAGPRIHSLVAAYRRNEAQTGSERPTFAPPLSGLVYRVHDSGRVDVLVAESSGSSLKERMVVVSPRETPPDEPWHCVLVDDAAAAGDAEPEAGAAGGEGADTEVDDAAAAGGE